MLAGEIPAAGRPGLEPLLYGGRLGAVEGLVRSQAGGAGALRWAEVWTSGKVQPTTWWVWGVRERGGQQAALILFLGWSRWKEGMAND